MLSRDFDFQYFMYGCFKDVSHQSCHMTQTCHCLCGKLMVLRSLEAGFPIGIPGNGRQYMHLVLMHNTLVVLMIEVIFQL